MTARALGRVAVQLDVVPLLLEVLLDRREELAVVGVQREQVVDRSLRVVRDDGRADRRATQPGGRRRVECRQHEREGQGQGATDTSDERHSASVPVGSQVVVRVATHCVPALWRSYTSVTPTEEAT